MRELKENREFLLKKLRQISNFPISVLKNTHKKKQYCFVN